MALSISSQNTSGETDSPSGSLMKQFFLDGVLHAVSSWLSLLSFFVHDPISTFGIKGKEVPVFPGAVLGIFPVSCAVDTMDQVLVEILGIETDLDVAYPLCNDNKVVDPVSHFRTRSN